MAREDENLRGQEVRLERSERTLRQQRPAGRATQWRVILYHRPNSKPCSTSRVFCICRPDGAALIRQYWRYCGWRHGRLIRPTGSVSPRRVWRFQPHLWPSFCLQKLCATSHWLLTILWHIPLPFFIFAWNFFCATYGWTWHFPLCVLTFMVLIAQICSINLESFKNLHKC